MYHCTLIPSTILTCCLFVAVTDRVLESTSMREKMAKYQAAVSKQGTKQSVS